MRNDSLVPWLAVVSLIAGCAAPTTRPMSVSQQATDAEALKQTELAIDDLIEKHKRARHVHRLLATKAVSQCGEDVGPDIGFFALTRPEGHAGSVMAGKYGIQERLTILFVLGGSPAEAAGLKAGDVIAKVNGVSLPNTQALVELEAKLPAEAPVSLDIERGGQPLILTVVPKRACRYPITISPTRSVNAFADGKRIMVTSGMVEFARTDDELALVIAHEMAHNTMRHLEAKKQNASAGFLADLAIVLLTRGQVSGTNLAQAGAMAYSQEFEAEADYVGLYILANAGLPIDDAPLFWRRMAAAHPGSIKSNHAASHPSTAYRMVALEGAVREIRAKEIAQAPLRPNMKNGRVELAQASAADSPALAAAGEQRAAASRTSIPPTAPRTSTAPAAPRTSLALAAPRSATADSAGTAAAGLPGAGTSWNYAVVDRIYGRDATSLTVSVAGAFKPIIEERMSLRVGSRVEAMPASAIDVGSTGFVERRVGTKVALIEFAPYFLAAHGESAATLPVAAEGYPVVSGHPDWIVRMARVPAWELVTVPAGTYKALRLEFDGRRAMPNLRDLIAQRFSVRVWYAPEVGRYVRLEQQEWTASRQITDVLVELLTFSPPS